MVYKYTRHWYRHGIGMWKRFSIGWVPMMREPSLAFSRRMGRRRWNALSMQMWPSKRYTMMAFSIILLFWTSWGRARLGKRWYSRMLAMQGKWGARTREILGDTKANRFQQQPLHRLSRTRLARRGWYESEQGDYCKGNLWLRASRSNQCFRRSAASCDVGEV